MALRAPGPFVTAVLAIVAGLGLCLGGSGCILDYDGLTGGSADASSPCVRIASPAPGFCIDATEVTRRAYLRFLDADGGSALATQPSECGWNTSFVPSAWPPAASELDLPVVGVDWCDARAFCAWAGKHLCGAVSGGALDDRWVNDAGVDAWYIACSHAGTRAYPYGDAFQPSACAAGRAELVPVAATASCQGGYDGLFDLSGNAREWIDACDGQTARTDGCRVRGGGYDDADGPSLACAASGEASSEFRDTQSDSLGFRCCAD